MGRNPASWFFWDDYMKDMRHESLEVNGAWIKILSECHWGKPRGRAILTLEQWSHFLEIPIKKAYQILQHIFEKNIADFKLLITCGNPVETEIPIPQNSCGNLILPTEPNALICIINRRMRKEEKFRENNRKRQKRHYDKFRTNE